MPALAQTLRALPDKIDLIHAVNISLERPMLAAAGEAVHRHIPLLSTPFIHFGDRQVARNYSMPHQVEVLRQSAVVLAQTRRELDVLAGLGVPASRLVVLGMGVNLADAQGAHPQTFRQQHTIDADTPIVTFIGALTYDKGAIHVLQAMQELWRRGSPAKLVYAGPAPLPGGFEPQFKSIPPDQQSKVIRLGAIPERGQLKQDLLAASTMLVMPSRVDSFGIVYLEAWAHCKPVIGADAGGVPDLIEDGVDGSIVPFGNVQALANQIQLLIEHPAMAVQLGASGRRKVEQRYTWDHIYEILLPAYVKASESEIC